MANKDCKITVRIPENILIQVENISKDQIQLYKDNPDYNPSGL